MWVWLTYEMWEQNLKMEDCWQRPLGPTIVPDLVATTFQFNLSWWKANQRFFSGQLPIQLDKDRKNILGRKGAKTSTFSNTHIAHTRLAQDLILTILLKNTHKLKQIPISSLLHKASIWRPWEDTSVTKGGPTVDGNQYDAKKRENCCV